MDRKMEQMEWLHYDEQMESFHYWAQKIRRTLEFPHHVHMHRNKDQNDSSSFLKHLWTSFAKSNIYEHNYPILNMVDPFQHGGKRFPNNSPSFHWTRKDRLPEFS